MKPKPPLWTCPRCGEQFTTKSQWHSCGQFTLDALFGASEPIVFELFERFRGLVAAFGPAKLIPQKSRVVFQTRMRFAALMPQKRALRGHLILSERHAADCFSKIETFSPRNHLHAFRLERLEQLDDQFRHYVGLAYRVGEQQHLD